MGFARGNKPLFFRDAIQSLVCCMNDWALEANLWNIPLSIQATGQNLLGEQGHNIIVVDKTKNT